MIVQCPKCGGNDLERQDGLGGDLRRCVVCDVCFYVEADYWQVEAIPTHFGHSGEEYRESSL